MDASRNLSCVSCQTINPLCTLCFNAKTCTGCAPKYYVQANASLCASKFLIKSVMKIVIGVALLILKCALIAHLVLLSTMKILSVKLNVVKAISMI